MRILNVFFLLCVLSALCVGGKGALSAEFSGDYLLQVCASDKAGKELSAGSHIACQAYISGIIDYDKFLRSLGTAPSLEFCIPEGTTLYQIQNRVLRHLAKNKQSQGPFIAAPSVALALYNSYPCQKKKRKKT